MYTVDGIVYAGDPSPPLRVVSVRPLEGWKLRLRCSTEEVKSFDFTPLLNYPCFESLRDKAVFKTVSLDHGVPVWCGGGIDIAPEKLYQDGVTDETERFVHPRTKQTVVDQQEDGTF